MFPAIEVYHHALWGVLQIESKGELTPDELDGQKNTGWGKLQMAGEKALNRSILNVKGAGFSMSTFIIHR